MHGRESVYGHVLLAVGINCLFAMWGCDDLEVVSSWPEAHRAQMEENRSAAPFPMGDLVSLLQSDEGKTILQSIVSELFAQQESDLSESEESSIDLAG